MVGATVRLAVAAAVAATGMAAPAHALDAVVVEGRFPERNVIVEGDSIVRPLTDAPGDPGRGAALIADRAKSLCLLCHTGPYPAPHTHGDIGPDLTGIGARLSEAQIRLRVADMRRLDPDSVMPTFLTAEGADRPAPAWAGRPILTAAEIEDLVALLAAQKE
jgi:sulfur-oxidizing protein SoxX